MKTLTPWPVLVIVSALSLSGCFHDDDDGEMMQPESVTSSYEITVTNLTAAQPLSPVTLMLTREQRYWQVGMPASEALALLAEAGDNSELVDEEGVLAAIEAAAPLGPGALTRLTVSVEDTNNIWLTVATMLVNTNDGFTGVTGLSLSSLMVNETYTMTALVYDAGTEANSERAGTIPGPADGGEGSSEGREPTDRVSLHPGVVSEDDGLSTSVLTSAHRFDNPAIQISVTRLE